MLIRKQLFGRHVQLELVGRSKEEVVQWRNYYWNWGAIRICNSGSESNCSDFLDSQEGDIDLMSDGFHFRFFTTAERLIKTYFNSMIIKVDWDKFSGKRKRQIVHQKLQKAAEVKFKRIPSYSIS